MEKKNLKKLQDSLKKVEKEFYQDDSIKHENENNEILRHLWDINTIIDYILEEEK